MAGDGARRAWWRRAGADVAVTGLLVVVAATAYGPYVADGGFTSDDWAVADSTRRHGYAGAVERQFDVLGSKPLLALLLPLPHALFGAAPAAHLVVGIVLAVSVVVLLYGLLVAVGLGRGASAAIALLALLFPWSDSNRLWATGAINNAAVVLYLLGAIVAVRALRARGRGGLLAHLPASVLYAASVLTYEAATGLALVTGALYLTAAPTRVALGRWALDGVAVGAAAAYTVATTVKDTVPLGDQLAHLPRMAREGASLWAEALVPLAVPHAAVAFAAGAFVVAAAAQVRSGARSRDVLEAQRRWLAVAGIAVAATAASYAVYVPSGWWHPRMEGLENRVNLLAALPLSALVFAVLVLSWLVLLGGRPARARRSVPAAMATCVLVAGGYLVEERRRQEHYVQAHAHQQRVLAAVERAVATPPDGATILTFGHVARVAPGIPVFYDSWDLYGALRLRWPERSIAAYPVFEGSRLSCGETALELEELVTPSSTPLDPARRSVSYDLAILVDVATATAPPVSDRAGCRRALERLTPGPHDVAAGA